MKFIRANEPREAAAALADRILSELDSDRRVLWLLSGGSNVPLSVLTLRQMRERLPGRDLADRLCVTLTDERYGPPGHADSNWQQLMQAGFDFTLVKNVPVLCNLSMAETAERFARNFEAAVAQNDVVVAQLGMGVDAHTAGILPGSPATKEPGWVSAYYTPGFSRITLTFPSLCRAHAAYLIAFGAEKAGALERLKHADASMLADVPAAVLASIPDSYVYTDL